MKKITFFALLSLGMANVANSQCSISSAPTNNCSYGDGIQAFTLNSINAIGNSGCGSNGYNSFTSPVWTLTLGSTYNWAASVGSAYYNEGVGIWIDLNGDGFYANSEFVASGGPAMTVSGTLSIPLTATVGTVRMRVRDAYSSAVTAGQACTNGIGFGYGETEDYYVNLVCPASLPTPAVTASTLTACSGSTVMLTGTGMSTYTWSGGITNGVAFTPTTTTVYTLSTGIAACPSLTGTTTRTITVSASPTITGVSSGSVCPGVSYVVTPSGASTYSYISSSGTVTGSSATLAPLTTTNYTVSGTGGGGCTSGANSSFITVTTLASPTLVVSASPASVCPGLQSVLSVSGANTYTWNGSTTGANFTTNPTSTTVYTVTGTGTNVCNGVKNFTVFAFQTPTVSVSNGTICSGYNFNISPSGASTYTITGPSGTVTSVVSPAANANYTVNGTSAQGCLSSTVTAPVASVVVRPSPTISVVSGTVCLGLSFNISPNGASSTYSINGVATTTALGMVSPGVNTTYSVTGTNTNGCVSPAAAVANVSVVANPTITAVASNTAICIGQATAVLTAGGASTYTWSTTDMTSSVAVSPTSTTIYTVTGTSTLLCSSMNTVSVLVNPLPVITAVPSKTFLCLGESVSIIGNGSNTYTWSSGGNTSSITASPVVSTTYVLNGTSAQGCTNTISNAIAVNTIVLTMSPNASVCLGSAVTVSASGALTYTWTTGHLFSTYPVSPTVTTVYAVNAVDMNGCPHSGSVAVAVWSLPNVSTTITRTLICTGESATITASGANSYSWTNGSTNASIVLSPTINLMQSVSVTGTDSNSCTAQATRTLAVSLCTGIDQLGGSSVKLQVYPNPNSGEFTISYSAPALLNLVNEIGQVVKVIELNAENNYSYKVSGLNRGVYFINAGYTPGFNQKVIVSH